MPPKLDLTGQRFGMLTAIKPIGLNNHGKMIWKCICDCGNTAMPVGSSLKSGNSKTCGCTRMKNLRKSTTKHGFRHHPLYTVWRHMKNRCANSNNWAYKWYGGRGITVCDKWINDAKAFILWALDNGWEKGLQIDRIDNDGNYEPSNCRFVTPKENANNRRAKNSFKLKEVA